MGVAALEIGGRTIHAGRPEGICTRYAIAELADVFGRRVDLENDPERQDSLLWSFTVLGEAVGQLSDEINHDHPEVGWASPAGCATASCTVIGRSAWIHGPREIGPSFRGASESSSPQISGVTGTQARRARVVPPMLEPVEHAMALPGEVVEELTGRVEAGVDVGVVG